MMLLGHVIIEGYIDCLTGLHIGASSDTIEIGGIDSPVVRNPINREPYIPGSSLKGKMRCLLERWKAPDRGFFNRDGGRGCKRHECDSDDVARKCEVCNLFGSTAHGKDNEGKNHPSMLIVCDGELINLEQMKPDGLIITEAKMENSIDRVTSAAHPRTIERVPAGARFKLKLILRVQGGISSDEVTWGKNLSNILILLTLIEKDGLGGNISRGYGQVKIVINRLEGIKVDNNIAGGFNFHGKQGYTFENNNKKLNEAIKNINWK